MSKIVRFVVSYEVSGDGDLDKFVGVAEEYYRKYQDTVAKHMAPRGLSAKPAGVGHEVVRPLAEALQVATPSEVLDLVSCAIGAWADGRESEEHVVEAVRNAARILEGYETK